MGFGDEDIDFVLSDLFSSPVTFGAGAAQQTTDGILTIGDRIERTHDIERQVRGPMVKIPAGSLAGVVEGSVITVDGVSYKVRQIDPSEHGRTQLLHITKT